jgi:hypothetical protein
MIGSEGELQGVKVLNNRELQGVKGRILGI